MGSNLESSSTSEVSETPEIETDNTQSAETDATSEDFEDCSVNEASDSDQPEACTDASEDDEDYSDCSAQMETQEEVPEIKENDEDDFSDCGVSENTENTTDADHIEEDHFDETEEATEEDEMPPEVGEVADEDETPPETEQATAEDEVPHETEEIADEDEIPPETEGVAEEDEIPPEMEEAAGEDEVPPEAEEVTDKNEVPSATDEAAEEETSDQTSENLSEENAESTADETDNSEEDAGEDKKEEKENLEESTKTTDGIEAEQAEMATQQERLSLQERIDKVFEKEEVSADEINKLKEEHAAELEAKVEERDAIEAQHKSKFDEVLSKEKGSEEYKQALQEYNALQDQKMILDEQVADLKKQQALLEDKENSAHQAQQPEPEEKSLFGWFNRKQPDTTEMPAVHFGTYEVDSYGFIKGENYQSYIKDWEGYSADRYKTEMFDQAREQMISPALVEGIRVSDSDVENPDIFWNQHQRGGTEGSFEEIAKNIPEVRDRLAAGASLNVLMEDEHLGSCAAIYFHPSNMPEVIKCGDYYEFQSNGRHRILAARNMGYDIPVKVIGERTIEAPGSMDAEELKVMLYEQAVVPQQNVWDEEKWGPNPFKDEWDEKKWGPNPFKDSEPEKAETKEAPPRSDLDSQKYTAIVGALENKNVEYRPIKATEKVRTEQEIIKRVSGGDMTKGSCSSLAFAYAGNVAGYDVLDYRDGDSRQFFSSRSSVQMISELPDVKATVLKGTNDIETAKQLLSNMQDEKAYYLATGAHAAIVKRVGDKYQYLELQHQSDGNGWHNLEENTLRRRFGCKETRAEACTSFLIDVDSLANSSEFRNILGYINTAEDKQRKGSRGSVR